MAGNKSSIRTLMAGLVAGIVASLCCIGPLVLVMLGIGGAWVSKLSAFEPFRPYFLGLALIFLFLAYRQIYKAPSAAACVPGTLCALPQTNRVYKWMLWLVAGVIGFSMLFPYFASLFY